MNWMNFQRQPPNVQVGLVRQWIAENTNTFTCDNIPLWMHLGKRRAWEALEELLAYGEQALLDARDEEGRGWLHTAIYMSMPPRLACMGLALLNDTWRNPDKYGRTPFEIFPNPTLAHAMAQRLWSENPITIHPFFSWAEQARTHHPEVARVWDFWSEQPNPLG